jgi:hypothetical protein
LSRVRGISRQVADTFGYRMDALEPHKTAARIRAAFAYEGINVEKDGEARTGIGKSTLRRMTAHTDPREVTTDELDLIVKACPSVPSWFILKGFEAANLPNDVDVPERVLALENNMLTVLRILGFRAASGGAGGSTGQQPGFPEGPKAPPGNDLHD